MNRDGHDNVSFFIGTEVEHTPAFGQLTLFVVGLQSIADITKALDTHYQLGGKPITHIYFGANQSFPNPDVNDGPTWRNWEGMIDTFLQDKYLCTLDIDVKSVEGLTESPLIEYHNFIPMISVKIPHVHLYGYNATIKIDDKDFGATNPGVWCHSLHNLQKREVFTDWSKYTKDEVIQ
jgi:hypothetical protein